MKRRIAVDSARCKGCLLCVDVCRPGLIARGEEINDQGYQYVLFRDPEGRCTACTLCAVMCPDLCIEVFKEGKKP